MIIQRIGIWGVLSLIAITGKAQQVDAGYLNPTLGGAAYHFLRLGTGTNYFGGIMWNHTYAHYGNGDDIVLFSYNARDINIQPNGGNLGVLSGMVSIGIATPMEKLDISGNLNIRGSGGANNNPLGAVKFYNSYSSSAAVIAQIQARRGINSHQKGDLAFYVKNGIQLIEAARIDAEGNLGIGTNTPRERLSVNGRIRAKEVKVEVANWPDYVFEADYPLPSLEELQKYIQINGHLPGIPTKAEVKQAGVNLGEMNTRLLEKIEELTLYIIAQQQELTELRQLKQEVKTLQKLFNTQN